MTDRKIRQSLSRLLIGLSNRGNLPVTKKSCFCGVHSDVWPLIHVLRLIFHFYFCFFKRATVMLRDVKKLFIWEQIRAFIFYNVPSCFWKCLVTKWRVVINWTDSASLYRITNFIRSILAKWRETLRYKFSNLWCLLIREHVISI